MPILRDDSTLDYVLECETCGERYNHDGESSVEDYQKSVRRDESSKEGDSNGR